ncbi:MAG TPA: hypothetical protein VJ783_06125 [Pirellulales bacterium]|nr:hypothetical protein [Pirellulales bacterium]
MKSIVLLRSGVVTGGRLSLAFLCFCPLAIRYWRKASTERFALPEAA